MMQNLRILHKMSFLPKQKFVSLLCFFEEQKGHKIVTQTSKTELQEHL